MLYSSVDVLRFIICSQVYRSTDVIVLNCAEINILLAKCGDQGRGPVSKSDRIVIRSYLYSCKSVI